MVLQEWPSLNNSNIQKQNLPEHHSCKINISNFLEVYYFCSIQGFKQLPSAPSLIILCSLKAVGGGGIACQRQHQIPTDGLQPYKQCVAAPVVPLSLSGSSADAHLGLFKHHIQQTRPIGLHYLF